MGLSPAALRPFYSYPLRIIRCRYVSVNTEQEPILTNYQAAKYNGCRCLSAAVSPRRLTLIQSGRSCANSAGAGEPSEPLASRRSSAGIAQGAPCKPAGLARRLRRRSEERYVRDHNGWPASARNPQECRARARWPALPEHRWRWQVDEKGVEPHKRRVGNPGA